MIEDDDASSVVDDADWYEHFRLTVDAGQALLRIDKFLSLRIANSSRSKIQAAAEAGNILVNNHAVKSNYRIKPFDQISVVFPQPPREIELRPENIPLNIVYEDDDVVVVNKPAGMVVHPGYGNYTGTLVNAILYHFGHLPSTSEDTRPGLVHRLDKDTTGLMVLAKNEFSLNKLAAQFFNRTTQRTYHALVWGRVEADNGTIDVNLGRSSKDRKLVAAFPDGDQGKHAVTHYKVLERFHHATLVECKLETGRTHQIRVHFKYLGHTLFGDEQYGGNEILKGTVTTRYRQFIQNCFHVCHRQALHAKTLGFYHPRSNELLSFYSDLPSDMSELVGKWRNYAAAIGEE